jgi:hypothetical protein
MDKPNFEDDAHALSTGLLIGSLRGAGVTVKPTLDGHDAYTPVLAVEIPLDPHTGQFLTVFVRVLAD